MSARRPPPPWGIGTWDAPSVHEGLTSRLEAFWESPGYCHCNFSALDTLDADRREAWTERILAMDWDDPAHRLILEMEGLRRWVRPELDGCAALFEATGGPPDAVSVRSR